MLADGQAIYPVQGNVAVAGVSFERYTMAVVLEATELLATDGPVRFAVVGGQPMGHRFIW